MSIGYILDLVIFNKSAVQNVNGLLLVVLILLLQPYRYNEEDCFHLPMRCDVYVTLSEVNPNMLKALKPEDKVTT